MEKAEENLLFQQLGELQGEVREGFKRVDSRLSGLPCGLENAKLMGIEKRTRSVETDLQDIKTKMGIASLFLMALGGFVLYIAEQIIKVFMKSK